VNYLWGIRRVYKLNIYLNWLKLWQQMLALHLFLINMQGEGKPFLFLYKIFLFNFGNSSDRPLTPNHKGGSLSSITKKDKGVKLGFELPTTSFTIIKPLGTTLIHFPSLCKILRIMIFINFLTSHLNWHLTICPICFQVIFFTWFLETSTIDFM
jgi:hypothetical protein